MTSRSMDFPIGLERDVDAIMLAGMILDADADTPSTARTRLSHAALWRHATRAPGDPVDLATLRALRDTPEARPALAKMIAARAIAASARAWAASDGSATVSRRLGGYSLILDVPDDGGIASLTLTIPAGGVIPVLLRAEGPGGSLLLALPAADENQIDLFLRPGEQRTADIVAILRDPAALIALE